MVSALFFFQAEDGIRDWSVTGVQTCALPILDGHAGAEGDGGALGVEGRLADGGFGEDDSGVVLIPIRAAFDAAGVTLHEHAVSVLGLDVEPDVSLFGEGKWPPGDVTDHHLAIACGGAGGGKSAATIEHGIAFLIVVSGWRELK